MSIQKYLMKISSSNKKIYDKAIKNWDDIAKPLRSLGILEEIHAKICAIQEAESIDISKRCVVPICADNGVVAEGVTQTGQEVTAIVTRNFLNKKTSVCNFAKVANCDVLPVDLGVAEEIKENGLIVNKLSYGTKNIAKEAAMDMDTAYKAINFGIELVKDLKEKGYKIIATGEMGIGNTTTSSAVASVLLNKDAALVTGYGSGLSEAGLAKKIQVIKQAIFINKPDSKNPIDIISKIGGYDIACMCGIFIGGAVYKMPIIIDGFIAGVAALCAVRLNPDIKDYIIASHVSHEIAAKLILKELDLKAIINAQMCLGEGTGAVALMPLLDMANTVYNEMPTFAATNIEAYEHFTK